SFGRLVTAVVARLDAPTRQLIAACAVLGTTCPLREAAQVSNIGDPLVALETAINSGLISASHDPDGWTVTFTHPLNRSAVYADLGPATRAALHARAALVVPQRARLHHRAAAC